MESQNDLNSVATKDVLQQQMPSYDTEPQMPTLNSGSHLFKDQSDDITDTRATNEFANKKIETNSEDSGSINNNEESDTKNASANDEDEAPQYQATDNLASTNTENVEIQESEYEEDDDDEPLKNATGLNQHTSEENNIVSDEKADLIQSQMEYLQNNSGLLSSPEFLNANLNTKMYLINKLLSESDKLKIDGIAVTVNQRRKRDHSSTYHHNEEPMETNPYEKNITSDDLAKLYGSYLEEEAKGGREFYPRNSRLFIANLPLNNVTKKNLFQIFHIYGKIIQINIKNNFGFIQYDSSSAVADAIKFESKRDNFGRKLVLEISNSTARPQYDHGDHGKNSSSTFVSSYKRFKNGELVKPSGDHYGNEKSIHIIVKQQTDRSAANSFFDYLSRNRGWMISMTFLNANDDLKSTVKKSAEENFSGCVVIKNRNNIDAIVFAKDMNGSSTFNEYSNVDRRDLIKLFGGSNHNQNYKPYMNNNSNNSSSNGNSGNHYSNNGNRHHNNNRPNQQNFPGMVTPNMAPVQSYNQMAPSSQYMNQTQMPVMNMGYQQQVPAQQQVMQPQGQMMKNMNNDDLFSQVQNLPPDVLKNLLANAQQQQQPFSNNNNNSSMNNNYPYPQQNNVDGNGGNDVLELLNNLTKK